MGPDEAVRFIAGAFPEIAAWAKKWSGVLGRDVNVGGFVPGAVPQCLEICLSNRTAKAL
jgi:hypothetical protein